MCVVSAECQNLKLDQLLSLRKKNLAQVEEYLTSQGWAFLGATEPSVLYLGKASFAYNKSTFDDKAESFITYVYSNDFERKRIGIQINKPSIYNSFLARVKSLGLKLISSEVVDGNIQKVYQGQTLTILISISCEKDSLYGSTKTIYNFFIVDNKDYWENYDTTIIETPVDTSEYQSQISY